MQILFYMFLFFANIVTFGWLLVQYVLGVIFHFHLIPSYDLLIAMSLSYLTLEVYATKVNYASDAGYFDKFGAVVYDYVEKFLKLITLGLW